MRLIFALVLLAPPASAQLLPEHDDLMNAFASARADCVESGFDDATCNRAEALAAELDAAGICYPAEQNPFYCNGDGGAEAGEGDRPADSWRHAAAPMRQFEGGLEVDDPASGIAYGCTSGTFSSVAFYADGPFAAPGLSRLMVDGKQVFEGTTIYDSRLDSTSFEASVRLEYGPSQRANYNAVLEALAGGSRAEWLLPTGDVFGFTLAGSADIRNCRID